LLIACGLCFSGDSGDLLVDLTRRLHLESRNVAQIPSRRSWSAAVTSARSAASSWARCSAILRASPFACLRSARLNNPMPSIARVSSSAKRAARSTGSAGAAVGGWPASPSLSSSPGIPRPRRTRDSIGARSTGSGTGSTGLRASEKCSRCTLTSRRSISATLRICASLSA
jgi:hypothetical protein